MSDYDGPMEAPKDEKPKQTRKPKAKQYQNTRGGVVDLKGVIFEAGEAKSLTAEQLKSKRVKHAIETGLIKEV